MATLPPILSPVARSPFITDGKRSASPGGKPVVVLGVCAMDVKARSKAMREILTRLVDIEQGGVEVKIFGDVVILEEDVSHWPQVDVLISFFSTDFPLPKALAYLQLPNRLSPISINNLANQSLLWDRRLVLAVLDHIGVPTPKRAEVSRDGGPKIARHLRKRIRAELGLALPGHEAKDEVEWGELVIPERWKGKASRNIVPRGSDVMLREDENAIIVNDITIEKPFVEKPVDGEDHNVYIYFRGGGGRRLFRKVGNKSSELDPDLVQPRVNGSFIYEEFINVDNAEDIKVYTVGPNFTHAETRKSPVVDGLVQRNAEGKETRFVTTLTDAEKQYARDVVEAFGQRVCGFDLLRCDGGSKSMVIDVNGWSFVKGNQAYYDKAAEILSTVCQTARNRKLNNVLPGSVLLNAADRPSDNTSSSTLRATSTVFRHADRTPKMKLKFSFPAHEDWAKPFLSLLRGHKEEIILRDPRQLAYILSAADESAKAPGLSSEILNKLSQLKEVLTKKMLLPGTKAQLKPSFVKKKTKKAYTIADSDGTPSRPSALHAEPTSPEITKEKKVETVSDDEDNELDSKRKVEDWLERGMTGLTVSNGIDKAHSPGSGSASSSDIGMVMATSELRNMAVLNTDYDSLTPEGLEKMQLVVKWGGESTHSARYQSKDLGESFKKDIMIMNKDVLDNVKIFTSSERRVVNTAQTFAHALLGYDREIGAASVANALNASRHPEQRRLELTHLVQRRDLLDDNNAGKEKMAEAKKMLKELLRPGESEKRPDLAWPKSMKKEPAEVVKEVIEQLTDLRAIMRRNYENGTVEANLPSRWCSGDTPFLFRERWEKIFDDWVGVKQEKFDPSRVSELYDSIKYDSLHNRPFMFAVFDPHANGQLVKLGSSKDDRRLHDLYGQAKALFDLVAPQEYGFDQAAKEEIAVLTSLPLLSQVWSDLEEAKKQEKSLASFYFTKESHIQTYVNLLMSSGLPFNTNVRIPELDYCSHCTIELWENSSGNAAVRGQKDYSIRLSISEGAHSPALLDSSVDSRHSLTVQHRKKLTSHIDYDFAESSFRRHFSKKGLSFSTTPLEGDEVYLQKPVQHEAMLPISLPRQGEDHSRAPSAAASERSQRADSDTGW